MTDTTSYRTVLLDLDGTLIDSEELILASFRHTMREHRGRVPPDDAWKGKVGSAEVQAFFQAMGSPGASTYSPQAPHPYMQKTRTLDACVVLEGEIVLVLDTQEVPMKAGEIAIQRGTSHAWSNRSGKAAVVAICSHDGKY